jgi:cell division protein FtsL
VTAPDRREQRTPARPHFTGRAAILAMVLCAIALSLAYPVREYVAERRQVDQLLVQRQQIAYQLRQLQAEQSQLTTPAFIEQQARDRLHMCLPTQICYVIIGDPSSAAAKSKAVAVPWYAKLWSSVQRADKPLPASAARSGQKHG